LITQVSVVAGSPSATARQIEVDALGAALDEPAVGLRVLEVKADRSSLRQLHAAIKAAL